MKSIGVPFWMEFVGDHWILVAKDRYIKYFGLKEFRCQILTTYHNEIWKEQKNYDKMN